MDKTEYMTAGSRQQLSKIDIDPDIKLAESNIRVKETKTLGVIVDEQFKEYSYIDNVITKASTGMGMIRSMKAFVPQ